MTSTDLGRSWLSSTPDGAVVIERVVRVCTVTAVFDDDFSAHTTGQRRRVYHPLRLVSDADRPLVKPGARFWLVSETVAGRPGEAYSAIAFRRPGALSPQRAFADRAGVAT